MKQAGIIGASGFIGSYVTKVFLSNGWKVRASVTDIKRGDKYHHLTGLEFSENLDIVEMNVTEKAALQNFVNDCDVVVHGGTPFFLDVKDPQTELFDPTINGTINFLEVVKETPGIEKVIFIASVAGYNTHFPMPPEGKGPFDTFSESDPKFTSTESHPYGQAKFIANETVEKFIEENPEIAFEISSVSPVLVMGKPLSAREDSTSNGFQFLFKNRLAPDPFVQMLYDNDVPFAMVDVDDVAQAIYKVATTPGLHGKNYLLSNETYGVLDICRMLNQEEPVKEGVAVYLNILASNELNMTFRPVKETLFQYSS